MSAQGRWLRRRSIEHTLTGLLADLDQLERNWRTAEHQGFLQGLDPRVKVAGVLAITLVVVLASRPGPIAAVLVGATMLAWVSGSTPLTLAVRVWAGVLVFSGILAVPALFLTSGDVAFRVPVTGWPVSQQGARSLSLLVLRAEATATLAFLLVSTTAWPRLLRALRSLRVPPAVVVVLGMTVRYAVLLLQSAHDMFEARRSRAAGGVRSGEAMRQVTATAGVLLAKTAALGTDVHLAMQARGFRGDVRLLDDERMQAGDWAAMATVGAAAALVFWLGR